MSNQKSNFYNKLRRRNRSKKTSRYNPDRLRMVIYRSLKHIEVQIIDDFKGSTVIAVSSRDKNLRDLVSKSKNKSDVSRIVGESLASKAKKNKIGPVVLDRNGYPYHGRVKAFADAARNGGLEF
jgi:large subunit ribosomal protein L18